MADFFTNLGQAVCAELASPSGNYPDNPSVREHLSQIMRGELDTHINTRPPTAKDSAMPSYRPNRPARDQGLPQPQGGSNYNQDPNDMPPLDSDDLMNFIQICLGKLDPGEKEQFLMKLTDLVSTTDGNAINGNGGSANAPSYSNDRRPRGDRRTARDGMVPSVQSAQDRRLSQDRAFAVRALNGNNFMKRFPEVGHLDVWK
jgi:hypothetical protein